MKKQAILDKIIAHLAGELDCYAKSARAAHAAATHEESKAEDKYDTRGLEASYLAHGQSRQVAEIERARGEFEALGVPAFGPAAPINLGALVELEGEGGKRSLYFIGPRAGGTEISYGKKMLLVMTPESPLGRQLIGKKQGDRLKIEIGGTQNEYLVVAVS
jgi:transcription elongation GreA/GreB family factor